MTKSNTKPNMSIEDAGNFASSHFDVETTEITDLGSYADQNFLIRTGDGDPLILKVSDSKDAPIIAQMQNDAVRHLEKKNLGISLPTPIENTDGHDVRIWTGQDGVRHAVRLLRYVEGPLLASAGPLTDQLLAQVGNIVGALDHGLEDFEHCASARPGMAWDLRQARRVQMLVAQIKDPAIRRIADYFFLQFEEHVSAVLDTLPMTMSHNDCHRHSLVMEKTRTPQQITGVIDFGDLILTNAVCHLANSLAYMIDGQGDIPAAAGLVAGAYHKQRPLCEEEIDILFFLVGLRLSVYAAMAAKSISTDPNNAHAQAKTKSVHQSLLDLIRVNPLYFGDRVRDHCGFPPLSQQRKLDADKILRNRTAHFSDSIYAHYQTPIVLERGALQYLHSVSGETFLDGVNNVCQWGHCHPTVARAIRQQSIRLNTNSRYGYSQMPDYAGALLETFPPEYDTVFLVNSGSEANDLAFRLASAFTRGTDAIVLDKAYHGSSKLCTDLSPQRLDRSRNLRLPDYVHRAAVPDRYRGRFGYDEPNAGALYAADVHARLGEIKSSDKKVAAFFAESLIGTGGQIVLPDGYLRAAQEAVRKSGGVYIADEVQMGLGRIGTHMWCFESHGVNPDIVTLGKPAGNGHPLAAVVTRREIAEAFDNSINYFNTFGGNPVSCAAGLAVLKILREEDILANVIAQSKKLHHGLALLQSKHEIIGDVRGQGLYVGVDLVKSRETKEPAGEIAARVVEHAKDLGVLLNVNGYGDNVIKIKPPLIVCEQDIDDLLTKLDTALAVAAQ